MTFQLASESAFRRIADIVLSASQAEHTLVNFNDSQTTTLRFANNQVVQHVSEHGPSLSVQVANGKKAGSASTNRLDRDSLIQVVRKAEELANITPDDPEYLPPLPQQNYLNLPTYRGSTASTTPMDLAKRTKPVIERCESNSLVGAGIMTSGVAARGVSASSGLFGYEQSTESEFSLTATADDSSGWTFNSHRDINALDIRDRAQRAVDKALLSKNPRELPAGKYPVILEPAAVSGVLGMMFWAAGAKSYYKGNSAFVGKLNTTVLDSRVTLKNDPSNPSLLGSRFGGEGLAARPMTWFDKGVLTQLFYDRFTAQEHNVEPTPRPSAPIMVFSGPTLRTTEDLIAQTDRAILVTNFWYIRMVNPTDLTVTGMTRDGTFLVENGKIVCGVKNFRFHESPLRCFAQIDAATQPQESITMERGKMLLPAVRLPEFNFSSVTKF